METVYTLVGLVVITFHIRGIALIFKHTKKHQYNAKWIYITCGIAQIRMILALIWITMEQ